MKVVGTPAHREVGRLRVDVGIGPAARMFPADEWFAPENSSGGAVFGGRADAVIERVEVDRSAEAAAAGIFNLDAHIHDAQTGHPVPYLAVSVVVQRGRATAVRAPLLPVARPFKGVAGLHYGNNVRLEPSGRYVVRVTIRPSALTGTSDDETVEFELDFDSADPR